MMSPSACRSLFALGVVAWAVVACGDDDPATPPSGSGSDPLKDAAPVVANYAANVHANYEDCLAKAQALKTAIDDFTAKPSKETQDAAKEAWKAARKPYGPSEVYRFYKGPIDNDTDGPEGELNSWPLDEKYIDYTRDDAKSGLVNDPQIKLSKDEIAKRNTEGGEANVSTGYHAIEFLLWGQDDPDQSKKTQGTRSFEDYTTKENADRRKEYLELVTELLVDDLQKLVDAWAPGSAYVTSFSADPKAAITKMLTGIGSMANAELAGERMTVAYKNKSEEDEHSCFSDTTNADLQGNFLGIQNVYLGTYGSNTTGAGISKLVAAVDPTLDAQVKADLQTAAAAFTAMQSEPFDFAIMSADSAPARKNVLDAIQATKKLATDITAVGAKLGVQFTVEAPSLEL